MKIKILYLKLTASSAVSKKTFDLKELGNRFVEFLKFKVVLFAQGYLLHSTPFFFKNQVLSRFFSILISISRLLIIPNHR